MKGIFLYEGRKGAGMDLFATALAFKYRERFGKRIIFGLTPSCFGHYELFTAGVMLQEIQKLEGKDGTSSRKAFI